MRIKCINCVIAILLSLIFTVQIILLRRSSSCSCETGLSWTPPINQDNIPKTHNEKKIQSNEPRLVFDPNTWIINNKVAQYSSKLILVENEVLIIEALVFFDFENQIASYIQSDANKCLMKLDEKIHELSIYEAISMDTSIVKERRRLLWRVR